jgi:hypothetical protein
LIVRPDKITQRFIEDFYYEGGELIRRSTGEPCGKDYGLGYKRFSAYGKSWLIHRVIFAINHGWFPKIVDHINRDKLDNRIENLRCARATRNNVVNSPIRSDNTSGFRGVIGHKQAAGWVAQGSRADGTRKHLGVYTCPKEAALAYNHHAEEVYGPFAEFNQVF